MSNLLRRMQRKVLRAKPDYEAPAQQTIVLPDGGYKTLTPTKGWQTFSARRLRAQRRMAQMLDHVIRTRPKKAPKLWRAPADVPAGTLTRQQIRRANRKTAAISA